MHFEQLNKLSKEIRSLSTTLCEKLEEINSHINAAADILTFTQLQEMFPQVNFFITDKEIHTPPVTVVIRQENDERPDIQPKKLL